MIPAIIQELGNKIANLGFVSLVGGVASDLRSGDKITPSALTYPLWDKPKFVDPDSNQTAIVFFKVGPTRSTARANAWLHEWENEVRLIGWLNGNRISEQGCLDAQMQILQAVRFARITPAQGSPLRMVTIEFQGDNEGQDIGQEYGWNDAEFQYGQYPYKLFELRFRLTYMVAAGCCLEPIDVLKPVC